MKTIHEDSATDPALSIEQQTDRSPFSKALQEALDTLTEEHRQVFLLRHQAQCSIREISEIATCSEGTVKSRLFYSMKKLAQKLRAFKP